MAESVRVTIIGNRSLEAKFLGANRIVREEIEEAANIAAKLWETTAKREAPHRTGRLRQSIRGQVNRRGGIFTSVPGVRGTQWLVGIDLDKTIAPYGEFVNTGTGVFGPRGRPFEVRPGGFIKDGKPYLNPGMRGTLFVEKGYLFNRSVIDRLFEGAGADIARRLD